jgi:hypothetical protein
MILTNSNGLWSTAIWKYHKSPCFAVSMDRSLKQQPATKARKTSLLLAISLPRSSVSKAAGKSRGTPESDYV